MIELLLIGILGLGIGAVIGSKTTPEIAQCRVVCGEDNVLEWKESGVDQIKQCKCQVK